MEYPDTIEILWGRLNGGLKSSDYSNWAMGLMMNGIENDDIIYLASNNDQHWQDIESQFIKVLQYLGESVNLEINDLCKLIENKMINKYESGEISAVKLVNECYSLWHRSNYKKDFQIWHELDEDINLCINEPQYGPIYYNLDKNDLGNSINIVLLSNKKLPNKSMHRSRPIWSLLLRNITSAGPVISDVGQIKL